MDPNSQNDVEAIVAASDAGVLSKKGIFDPDIIKKFDYNGDGNITHRGGELEDMREYLQKNEKINQERDIDDSPDANQENDTAQNNKKLQELQEWRKEVYEDGPLIPGDTDSNVDWESQLELIDDAIAYEKSK